MRARMKPLEVTFKVYKEGMEDGFLCNHYGHMICNEVGKPLNMKQDYPRCIKCKISGAMCNTPYVSTIQGDTPVEEGDYIITDVGHEADPKRILKPVLFHMMYDVLEGDADAEAK